MHVGRHALEAALSDADYPADKEALLSSAGDGTPDEVVRALRSLPPEVQYANLDEVVSSVTVQVEGR